MKICTITCHRVYNYGACLQAYALQKYLSSRGHDVRIIDYYKEGTNDQFDFLYVSPNSKYYALCKRFKFFNLLFALLNSYRVNYSKNRNKAFDSFQKQFYNLTQHYSSICDLKKNPPTADVYIAGSDQIWNPIVDNGKDLSFYLDFGDASVKRVSYAASFSVPANLVPADHYSFVKPLLSRFTKISVRESSGLDILKVAGVEGVQVLDPVFLLTQEEWCSLLPKNRPIKFKYILVYHLFAESEGLQEFVKKEAEVKGLKIVAINDRNRRNYADIQINDAGPLEFIHYIAHAEMVVADSFHATAFSIIMNKDFHVFYRLSNISRMVDLLGSLGIRDRINSVQFKTIDWNDVNDRVLRLRNESLKFLDL